MAVQQQLFSDQQQNRDLSKQFHVIFPVVKQTGDYLYYCLFQLIRDVPRGR